jgi:hypothetical protein
MCSERSSSRIVLLCSIVLCSAAAVRAQDLQVSPTSWDFGNVVVGTSETVTFDLLSGPPTEVWVFTAFLNDSPDTDPPYVTPYLGSWSLGPFSFNPATHPTLPLILPVGEHLLVDVTFTPPSPGDYYAYFGIESNDSIDGPGPQAFFPLEGTGVPQVVPLPGAALLGVIGLSVAGCIRRRRAL